MAQKITPQQVTMPQGLQGQEHPDLSNQESSKQNDTKPQTQTPASGGTSEWCQPVPRVGGTKMAEQPASKQHFQASSQTTAQTSSQTDRVDPQHVALTLTASSHWVTLPQWMSLHV